MRRMFSPQIRITKWCLAILLLMIVYAIFAWWLMESPPRLPERPQLTVAEKEYFAERFRYHGITGAICEGDVCWFVRDGKRCRL